jgi:hypothetical protein
MYLVAMVELRRGKASKLPRLAVHFVPEVYRVSGMPFAGFDDVGR